MPGGLGEISPNQRIDLLPLACFGHIFRRVGWYRPTTIYSTVANRRGISRSRHARAFSAHLPMSVVNGPFYISETVFDARRSSGQARG